ncbi:MAG: winged helix-turn-helix transcriptional regulator [Methanobacteriota archaeon]
MKNPEDPCPHLLEGVINVIGDKWSILIIGTIGNFGTLRFHELKDKLGGISPKTLAEKLRRLHGAGLLRRESFNEVPPRVEYSLTRAGQALQSAMIPLLHWATRTDHA